MRAHVPQNRLTDLDFCTDDEKVVLIAIAALAKCLTNPSPHYVRALGDITSRYFTTTPGGGSRGVHNPSPGSLSQTHQITVTKRYGVS